jgi:hypothetical protein
MKLHAMAVFTASAGFGLLGGAACSSGSPTANPPIASLIPRSNQAHHHAPPTNGSGSGSGSFDPSGPDHGAVSTTYPGFTPDIGTLVNNGGDVLSHPVFVTVTWKGDENAAYYEDFGDKVGESAYWKTIVAEYGVGAGSSGKHVQLDETVPAKLSDKDLDAFVADHVEHPPQGWPAPTAETIYILYLPSKTILDLKGNACDLGVGGYHTATKAGGRDIAYAIIPQCVDPMAPPDAVPLKDVSTLSASHELAEASVDPYPATNPAWVGFDDNHLAWEFFQQFQSENGDACEFYQDSFFRNHDADLPFAVQRQWSNAAAVAGHNPCVPSAAGPYFNVTPLLAEDITIDLSALAGPMAKAITTKGVHIPVGSSKAIPLGFYSDAATDAWTIDAKEGGLEEVDTKTVDLTLDMTKGQNGEKAYLTVKVLKASSTHTSLVSIVSSLNGTTRFMPILIGTGN